MMLIEENKKKKHIVGSEPQNCQSAAHYSFQFRVQMKNFNACPILSKPGFKPEFDKILNLGYFNLTNVEDTVNDISPIKEEQSKGIVDRPFMICILKSI